MQDPYPATFQRRHHNISLGAVFFSLHVNNNLSQRFAYASKGTYNSLSDFPTTGSGFGVNQKVLTLYTGFVIPEYSRICFMNYGGSPDAAISAVSPSGDIYSAFRNGNVWQNGKISASKDDVTPVKYTGFTAGTGKTITENNSYCVGKLLIACLKVKIEGTGGQVVKIASNILNSGGSTIVGIGTEWSVTKSIYMYIGYDSLVVNEEDFALGQYLHICVPLVLK